MQRSQYLRLEAIGLYGFLPLLVCIVRQRPLMIAVLWLAAIGACVVLKGTPGFSFRAEWNAAALRTGFKDIGRRFLVFAVLIAAFTYIRNPDFFLSFPLKKPAMWALVMALYPILSVLPQEILYRSYFFQRYGALFSSKMHVILVSALAFGYGHLVFNNWIAIVFCTIGGLLFGSTYVRHRSLALVFAEHALYGCFIYTVGLGYYFYTAAWGG